MLDTTTGCGLLLSPLGSAQSLSVCLSPSHATPIALTYCLQPAKIPPLALLLSFVVTILASCTGPVTSDFLNPFTLPFCPPQLASRWLFAVMNRSSRFHCPILNSDDPSQTNWTSLPRPQSQVSMLLTSFLQADRQAPWTHYKIRSRLAVKGTVASCIHFGWRFYPSTLSPSIPTLLLRLCLVLASAILTSTLQASLFLKLRLRPFKIELGFCTPIPQFKMQVHLYHPLPPQVPEKTRQQGGI